MYTVNPCVAACDNVIRFIAVQLNDRNIKSPDDLFHLGHARSDVFRHFLTVCFIGFKNFIAEGRGGCIKGNADVGRLLFLQNLQQRIGKAKRDRGVNSLGTDPWVFAEREVSPVDQGVGIKEK
jgi:hypothetical protein